jgi:hypothetical protein
MSTIKTVIRLAQINTSVELQQPLPNCIAPNEMDSNADTCCAGSNFIALSLTRRTADVYPYNSSYEPLLNVPIASAATAYDDPDTGQTYILVLNECLYYGTKLKHSLINPNQLRSSGTPVWDNIFDPNHDISIECEENLTIPLKMEGTKTLFISRSPTDQELNECPHIHITSTNEWNPSSVKLDIQSIHSNTPNDWNIQRHVSAVSTSLGEGERFEYSDIHQDESILHSIEPSLVTLSELHSD